MIATRPSRRALDAHPLGYSVLAVAAAAIGWLAVWNAAWGSVSLRGVGTVLVFASFGTVAVATGMWLLLRRDHDGPTRFLVATSAAGLASAAVAPGLRDASPLLLGAAWTLALVSLTVLIAAPSRERLRELGVAAVIWMAALAVWWWVNRPAEPLYELIWSPSDAIAYARISHQLSAGRFEQVPYLVGFPWVLQPFTWALGSSEVSSWGELTNRLNLAVAVPTTLLVMPAGLVLVGRTLRTVLRGDAPPATPNGREAVVARIGSVVTAVLLVAYASSPPGFAHPRTAEMAARRMVGVALGPETMSVAFAAALLLVLAKATRNGRWNPLVIGIAMGVAPLVREYNAALVLLTLALLATIRNARVRTLQTAGIAALAFLPQLVIWLVVYHSAFLPNRFVLWSESNRPERWDELVVERYGLHFSGDPPQWSVRYLSTNLEHWLGSYWWLLGVSVLAFIVTLVVERQQWRLWVACLLTIVGTVAFNACYINITPQYRYNGVIVPAVAVLVVGLGAILFGRLGAVSGPRGRG